MLQKFLPLLLLLVVTPTLAWRSAAGLLQGSLYGRPCTNGTVTEGSKLVNCDREAKSLVCSSSGNCECAPSEKATIYDEEMKNCVLVPYPEDDFRCTTNFQCHVSSYGRHSRCNNDLGKCECFEEGLKTELKSDVCYTLTSSKSSEAYPSCRFNDECTRSDLGNLTRCNMATLQCECYDTLTSGKRDAGFYQGRCVIRKLLGDFCESDAECKVTHGNAHCAPHTAYLTPEKTCQCPEGDPSKCEDGGSSGAGDGVWVIGIATILMGVVATRVVS